MEVLNTSGHPLGKVLGRAVAVLRGGGIVAYPTETFYALGVKYDQEESLRRLYAVKQRPLEKALPLIIGNMELLPFLSTGVSRTARFLMEEFWPGPLTIVLPASGSLSEYVTAGTHTVAVRIPGQSPGLLLAEAAGFPFTATSANISGFPPADSAETVAGCFKDMVDLIIDGGRTPGGMPSTIVDGTVEPVRILREGALKKENMAASLMPG